MTNLPVLGAALTVEELETHRDFILHGQRDLELQSFFQAVDLEGDWRPKADRAKTLLDGYTGRLGIHGPFWGFTIDSHDPAVRAVVQKRMHQGLDACAILGADQMVIHSPYTTWDFNNLDNRAGSREDMIERCHLTLKEVVGRAEDMGCVLVIENIEDKDPDSRVVLADSFNSPSVAVSLDTGHAHYAYGTTGAPPVDYYVKAAGDRLQHVHLQDADGYADRHWRLGEGTIRWHSVFEALGKLTSNPRLIIEIKDKSEIPASVAFLEGQGLAR